MHVLLNLLICKPLVVALVLKHTAKQLNNKIKNIMKKTTALLLIGCAFGTAAFAQCDKKILYTSVKQDWLNSKYEVQKSDQDNPDCS